MASRYFFAAGSLMPAKIATDTLCCMSLISMRKVYGGEIKQNRGVVRGFDPVNQRYLVQFGSAYYGYFDFEDLDTLEGR